MQVSLPNGAAVGTPVTLAIRPEHVGLKSGTNQDSTNIRGKITSKNYLGDAALIEVEVNSVTLLVKLAGDTELAVGQEALLDMPPHRWQAYP
jgi:multiple sugar transport system ATP-binding protein